MHSIWVIWTNGLQECKGQVRVRACQGPGAKALAFSVMPDARHPDECNARQGHLERRGKEEARSTSMCSCLAYVSYYRGHLQMTKLEVWFLKVGLPRPC